MLNVFDVSAIVHTAMANPHYRDKERYGFPVGGIYFLSMYLCNSMMSFDDMVLCFDSPCFRSREFPEYKRGRAKNMAVILQLEVLYEQLQKHGIRCLKLNGYEADDLIEWSVAQYQSSYPSIVIYSNDMDLCHSVRGEIRLKSIRKDVNSICYTSFSDCIEKGEHIIFNTISAYKVFCGCKSDGIPVMRLENGMHGKMIYQHFAGFCKENGLVNDYVRTASPKLLPIYAKYSGLFSSVDKIELAKRIRLVYPAARPDGFEISPVISQRVDKGVFSHFLSLFEITDAFKRDMWFIRQQMTEKDKIYLKGLAKRYSSGEYSADKNIPYSEKRLSSSVLRLDTFTKDF